MMCTKKTEGNIHANVQNFVGAHMHGKFSLCESWIVIALLGIYFAFLSKYKAYQGHCRPQIKDSSKKLEEWVYVCHLWITPAALTNMNYTVYFFKS